MLMICVPEPCSHCCDSVSRRFVESGKFKAVIAADFSETMLDQTKAFFQESGATPRR